MRIREATDIESRRVVTVEPRDTIADVVYLLEEYSIGAVVVTSDGQSIEGILSERDIVRYLRIEHEGETYTLRLTRNDRLILTK